MFIKQIKLNHFMNHTNSVIELSDFLTCITGPNDSGKSVILYAVRWFCSNEPKGNQVISDFTSNKAKKCAVELVMSDGTNFIKERTINGITLFKAPSWNKEWSKSDLPKEIADIISIDRSVFGNVDFDLNFSFQLDAPFLISESGASGATVISKFAGTEVLDLVNKDLDKENWRFNRENDNLNKAVEALSLDINRYSFLDKSKESLNKAVKEQTRALNWYKELNTLVELRSAYIKLNDRLNVYKAELKKVNLRRLNSISADLVYCDSKIESLESLINKGRSLSNVKLYLDTLNRRQEYLSNITRLDKLNKDIYGSVINFNDLLKYNLRFESAKKSKVSISKKLSQFVYIDSFDVKDITTQVEKHLALSLKNFSFKNKKDKFDTESLALKSTRAEEQVVKKSIDKIWEQIGYVCPTCNSIITKKGEKNGSAN